MNRLTAAEPGVDAALEPFAEWDGSTYYGRQQLKPWPFEAPDRPARKM